MPTLSRKVAVNASLLIAGRALVAASGVVTVGVSTRYLGPTGFGALAVASAFVGIFGTLTDFGLFTIGAREIAKRPGERQHIVSSLFTLGLIASLLMIATALAVMSLIYGGADHELERRGVEIMLLSLLVASPIGTAGAVFLAEEKAYLGMVGAVSGTVLSLGAIVMAATLDLGYAWMVSGYAVAFVGNAATMVVLSRGRVRLSLAFDLPLWRQLLRWAVPVGAVAVVGTLYHRIDLLLVAFLASDAEAAYYAVAYKFFEALAIIPGYVVVTVLPTLARLEYHSERLAEVTQKTFAAVQIASVALVVLAIGLGAEVIQVVAGPSFERSILALQILMVALALGAFVVVFVNALIALNQQRRLLWISLAVLVVNVALNLALIPVLGIYGAAGAYAVTEVLALVAFMLLYRTVGALPRIHRPRETALAALAMSAVLLLKLLPPLNSLPPIAILALVGAAALTAYAGALYALRAVPEEVSTGLVAPVLARLRRGHQS